MSAGRVFLVLVLIAAGLGISIALLSQELPKLHAEGFFNTNTPGLLSPTPARPHANARGAHSAARHPPDPNPHESRHPARRVTPTTRSISQPRKPPGISHVGNLHVLLVVALEIAGGVGLTGLLVVALVLRRTHRRSRRDYGLYALHLSMHDEAKPQDLEDMVESIANIIRAFPAERIRTGQPYVALELICGEAQQGVEWSVNVRCEPASVRALDAAISAAYPDVRVGRRHADEPVPRTGTLRQPGHVMRFRKQRTSSTRCSRPANSSHHRRLSRSPVPRSRSARRRSCAAS